MATRLHPSALIGGAAVGLGYWSVFGPRSQLFGPFPYRGQTDDKTVALTFDDGPNEPFTSALLDILQKRNVKATFFQVGRCAERFPSTTRRVVDSGHVLGNHSFSHSFSRYLTQPGQRLELEHGQEALSRIAGVTPGLYRPPWLCHWPWVLRTISSHRLQVVSGTFGHPLEVFQPPARMLAAGVVRVTRPGSIVILHDGREARGGPRGQSVAAVSLLIDRLRDQGYTFTTVDQLLGVPPYL